MNMIKMREKRKYFHREVILLYNANRVLHLLIYTERVVERI